MESPTEAPKSDTKPATRHSPKFASYFDQFTASFKLEEINNGAYGSVTDVIKDLLEKKRQIFNSINERRTQVLELNQLSTPSASQHVSGLKNVVSSQKSPIIIIDSDDEEISELTSINPSHLIASAEPAVDFQINRLAETWTEKQKLIERHEDINETRKIEGTYPGRENDTPMDQNLQTDSNFTEVISDKETSDKESTCIGSDDPQKTEGNRQIGLDTQVVDDNCQICFGNVMLVADNGFEGDDPNVVDMEIDNDDILSVETCVPIDMEIESDDTLIEDAIEQNNLDNSDSEVEDDADNDQIISDCDDLENVWNEMNFALECSKDIVSIRAEERVREEMHDCDHSFVLKEDLGYVCRVCGVIQRGIDTIIEYQFAKNTRSTRTYHREALITNDKSNDGSKLLGQDIPAKDFAIHPRHMKQMKSHQLEGFNFLQSNLVTDNPGGCILAHAPGSGKTFMIISFMQSFLAKYSQAKPLVVLPRGILSTWKKEFIRWQVEDIPLYDFYSMRADSRAQQLEVLKQWAGQKSILFLGYKQFSSIVCDDKSNETAASCQKFLLQYPSILILDEGHTPRNEETDVLSSLKQVQTPRKVVLSGTLYQNHVKEVFNIFDLVRPKFLRQAPSRAIFRRILSKVSFGKKHDKTNNVENVFYDSVESTLQKDNDFKRKISVIQDLREMTSKVLHFYKGDFLDELPGLLDFTLFLNLSNKQKEGVKKLKKLNQRFKVISEGSALYVHPHLRKYLKSSSKKEREGLHDSKMDIVIEKLEISDGVKAKFFINLLGLCEATGEKLLVFSQYIQPLKFLERLIMKTKGWSVGKEIFVITGDSNSESRDSSMEQFNNSTTARLFFGSIKACGEGISLVGASRIIILDIHLNPSVTRQAIGRAFRPGQKRKVFVYRLVAAESPEEEDHSICYKKESIAKMWFEWNECCGHREFEMRSMDVRECGDEFLESPKLSADIKSLYQR